MAEMLQCREVDNVAGAKSGTSEVASLRSSLTKVLLLSTVDFTSLNQFSAQRCESERLDSVDKVPKVCIDETERRKFGADHKQTLTLWAVSQKVTRSRKENRLDGVARNSCIALGLAEPWMTDLLDLSLRDAQGREQKYYGTEGVDAQFYISHQSFRRGGFDSLERLHKFCRVHVQGISPGIR